MDPDPLARCDHAQDASPATINGVAAPAMPWDAHEVRLVIYGAGAIDEVLGARLFLCGHDVTLIARGAHLEASEPVACGYRIPAAG